VLQTRQVLPLRRQRGRSGLVEVQALPDGRLRIAQPPAPLEREPSTDELNRVLEAVNLPRTQLDTQCPARIAGASSTRLLIGLQSAHDLASLTPHLEKLAALSPQLGAQGYFFYTREAAGNCTVQARMFCPAIGIAEDPVSGNAYAMLGHYLFTLGLLQVDAGCARFSGAQGASLSRPGQVDVEVRSDEQGRAQTVSIAGRAVVVFEARLALKG
jgi:PhzF family phenazine biosynthesis protein